MGRDRASYVFVDHFGSRDEDVCSLGYHPIDPRLDARAPKVTGSRLMGS